jgi:hypothetical protein
MGHDLLVEEVTLTPRASAASHLDQREAAPRIHASCAPSSSSRRAAAMRLAPSDDAFVTRQN